MRSIWRLFKIISILLTLASGCAKNSSQNKSTEVKSMQVQYSAVVDNTRDGCGTALCTTVDQNYHCAFPQGIPREQLVPGAQFWVEGTLVSQPTNPNPNTCMGMVSDVLQISKYQRLN